jgi:anionic cell wall polymer biosynthesis LytR-Cps2A-Psr (LCP) family protein
VRRIVIIVVATLAVLTAGGVSAIWAYGRSLDHNLKRTDAFAGLPSDRPTETVSGAMNVLVLGSDSRDPDSTADSRTDTIMLLHVDADHQHAYAISIPRDTWVDVPGHSMAKINAAYAFTKGTHHFDGAEALDYIRQREQFADGDFTRERHQQEFLTDLMDKAASTGTLTDPVKLNAFLQALTKSVTVDEDFNLVSVAYQFRDLRSNDITFLTSPSAGTAIVDGQSVVRPDTAKAKSLYQKVNNS